MKDGTGMFEMTDRELFNLGWKWALREPNGDLLAVSFCMQDAMDWCAKNRGDIIMLMSGEVLK